MKSFNYTDPKVWVQVKAKMKMVQDIKEGEVKRFMERVNSASKENDSRTSSKKNQAHR